MGLNTWHSAGAAPAAADSIGLRSFTIELPREHDVHAALARIETAGIASVPEEGGTLVRDPFGNGVLLTAAR